MNKISCIIVEDQIPAQKILKRFIEQEGSIECKASFVSALDAFSYLKNETVDLMFLDIHLPQLSGIELLRLIEKPPIVIFTTAYNNYAIEAFDLDVIDYLLKPFSFDRFNQSIEKVYKFLDNSKQNKEEETIIIKDGHNYIKLVLSEIIYIKADGDYTHVVTSSHKYLINRALKEWLDRLNDSFIQVHRSYIVNISKVIQLNSTVILIENTEIPLGRKYKEQVFNLFSRK